MIQELKLPLPRLNNDEKAIFDLACKVAEKIPDTEIDQLEAIPQEVLTELKNAGFFGLGYPESFGGCFISELGVGLAVMAISYKCASTGIVLSVHNSLVGSLMNLCCNESQKTSWFQNLALGDWISCFCLSEAEAGSDVKNLRASLRPDGDYYFLNGQKNWVTNGPIASVGVVFAKELDGQISAIFVDLNADGITKNPPEKKLGIRGASTCSVSFNEVKVSKFNTIGQAGNGLKVALSGLNSGRLGVACQSLGIGWRAFYEAFKYANERIAFGQKIIAYQLIQDYLCEMRTRLDHATSYTFWVLSKEEKTPRECAEAKLFASKTAVFCADKAVQIFGGNGYVQDFVVERLYRDARITEIYEGSSEMQKINIVKFLLKEIG